MTDVSISVVYDRRMRDDTMQLRVRSSAEEFESYVLCFCCLFLNHLKLGAKIIEKFSVLSFFSSPTFLEIARTDGAIVKSTPFSN